MGSVAQTEAVGHLDRPDTAFLHAPTLDDSPSGPLSGRGFVRLISASLAVVGLLVALVAGIGWWALSGGIYGCTPRDQQFAATLNELEVLELRPPDATAQGDRFTGCDDDDGFAFAGQIYRPAGDRSSIVAFYRDAPVKDGWTLQREDDHPVGAGLVASGSSLCFTKPVDGTTAYLSIWFPSDFGDPGNDYGVEVTASHDGGAWC